MSGQRHHEMMTNAFPAGRVKRSLAIALVAAMAVAVALFFWPPSMNSGLERKIENAKQFKNYTELEAFMAVPPGGYRLHDKITKLYPPTYYHSPKNLIMSSAYPGHKTAVWYTDKYALYVVYSRTSGDIVHCAILRPVENPFQPVY